MEDHQVKWIEGQYCDGKEIAYCENNVITINDNFKDLLQLNPLNGALTFIGITKNLAAGYCVKIKLYKKPYILRRYFLGVYGRCPKSLLLSLIMEELACVFIVKTE